jgi:tRNA pseudouridine55 synthase
VFSGFLLINKPVGISSYACINHIKRIIRQEIQNSDFLIEGSSKIRIKIGHAGTLDPFACGLLIVAIGRQSTKLLSHCMAMPKTYVAMGKCGELTDTLDCTGQTVATSAIIPSQENLRTSLESFGSSYEQIPPIYSALKHAGMPLYLLARKNMLHETELQTIADAKRRSIQLYDKQFLSYEPPFFTIQVTVSQGTYIRTLINDIAQRAGSCATTYELVRTSIGRFTLTDAWDLSSLDSIDAIKNALIILAQD